MPKDLSPGEVRAILDHGKLDELIAAVENSQLDAKRAPYRLDVERQKLELAKDVTGFANARGGVILLGVETAVDAAHYGDEIKRVHPFPQDLVDLGQYQDVLRTWVYPPLRGVDIRWFPSVANPDRGIVAIFVAEQQLDYRP